MPADRFALLKTPLPTEAALDTTPMADFKGLAFMALSGHDSLSRCFEFDISAISGTPDLKSNDLLGQEVGLKLTADRDNPDVARFFHGIVDGFRFAGSDDEGHWLYHLILRPRLWLLGKTTDNRIFQEMTVVDIVSEILDQHGCTDYEWNLLSKPPQRDYCVQYDESDLNFVQRLLEHEGIFYFFRFEDGKHALVLCDDVDKLKPAAPYGTLEFRDSRADRHTGTGRITRFSRVDSIVPGSHSLTDYDFEKPSADLTARSENALDHSESGGARYSYPGNYIEHGRGDDLARIRNRQDQSHACVITALSTAAGPSSGNMFKLTGFPRSAENDAYVIERAVYDIRGSRYRTRGRDVSDATSRALSIEDDLARTADGGGFSAIYTLVPQGGRIVRCARRRGRR
ncbi:type VI secretion system Vgr family protein [Paracoccus methylarcula]|uniref:Type VI secretion system tip protein VgrG n=1 Tax=Paracoccus methylarcula TaxID=72022 RepID=A0A422R104_9RHOB|nr:type VI secretion system tip protein TssI/VgrG [Paracoccus methylarcula]RNF35919.1 type VI secretion system tip protein VgrG [Paracoccus methylarcula]